MKTGVLIGLAIAIGGIWVGAQTQKAMSPDGTAAAQVGGTWVTSGQAQFSLGRGTYQGGKWIEVSFGRPLKRGRDLWGSGPNYGKDALVGAPLWRAGANVTTRLMNEAPMVIAGKTLAPGEYTLFIDLKENNWTFVVSTLKAQLKYNPDDKTTVWGAYNYTPDKDVLRAPMKVDTLPHSFEQLSWQFLDMTPTSGTLEVIWDKVMASVPFTVG